MFKEIVSFVAVALLEASGVIADPIHPPTTQQCLRQLSDYQKPLDAKRGMSRVLPEVKFDRVPLSEGIDFISDVDRLNIVLDSNELLRLGISLNVPITLHVRATSVADTLDEMLNQADPDQHRLRINVQDEFVFISTPGAVATFNDFINTSKAKNSPDSVLNRRLLVPGFDRCTRSCGPTFDAGDDHLQQRVRELSVACGVAITVDSDVLRATECKGPRPMKFRLTNPTLADALTVLLKQSCDLNQVELVTTQDEIRVTSIARSPAPSSQQ